MFLVKGLRGNIKGFVSQKFFFQAFAYTNEEDKHRRTDESFFLVSKAT